jgi:hypothetical protein
MSDNRCESPKTYLIDWFDNWEDYRCQFCRLHVMNLNLVYFNTYTTLTDFLVSGPSQQSPRIVKACCDPTTPIDHKNDKISKKIGPHPMKCKVDTIWIYFHIYCCCWSSELIINSASDSLCPNIVVIFVFGPLLCICFWIKSKIVYLYNSQHSKTIHISCTQRYINYLAVYM